MSASTDLKVRIVTDKGSFVGDTRQMAQAAQRMGAEMVRAMGGTSGAAKVQQAAFDRLRASVDPAFASSQRFAEIQRDVAAMVTSGAASQRAANVVLEQAAARYMGVATAADRRAAAERELAAAQRAQATAVASATRDYEALRASVDPLYAASRRYESALETLNAAQKAGVLSDQQRQRTLDLLEAQLIQTGAAQLQQAAAVATATRDYESLRASVDPLYAASRRYESALETLNAAQKAGVLSDQQRKRTLDLLEAQMIQTGAASAAAAGGIGRFTPAITNASFQVQDFAVQVASGQSALVAFAQQFPQLAGAMGFSGTLALWGAAIGTIAAVGIAVAPMLFEMGDGADRAKEAIDELTDATARYTDYSAQARMSASDMAIQWGVLASQGSRAAQILAEFAQADAVRVLADEVDRLSVAYGGLSDTLVMPGGVRSGLMMEEWRATALDLQNVLSITEPQALAVVDALKQMNAAATDVERIDAAVRFSEAMTATFGSVMQIPKELQAAAQQAALLAVNATAVANAATEAERQREAAALDAIRTMGQQAALLAAIVAFGEDSAQVEAIKRDNAIAVAEAYAQQQNLTGALAVDYVAAATALYDAEVAANQNTDALLNAEAAARALIADYQQQALLSAVVARYGEDSAVAEGVKRTQALMAAQAYNQQNNLTGSIARDLIDSKMAAYDAAVNASEAAARLRDAEAAARGLASAMAAAAGFSANLDAQIATIGVEIDALRSGADAALAVQVHSLQVQAAAQRDATMEAAAGESTLINLANQRYATDLQRIDAIRAGREEVTALNAANRGTAASGGAAASATAGQAAATQLLETRITAMDAALAAARTPLEVFNHGLAELNELAAFAATEEVDFGRAYAHGLQQLNDELFQSIPLAGDLVDTLTNGLLNGFSGTLDDLGDLFKSWLAEMIATAARNAIVVSINPSGAGATGGALGGGLSGILGGALGSWGTAGVSGTLVGSAGLMGGLGQAFAGGMGNILNIGANAAAAGGTLMATLGAALPVIGAAALAIAAFRSQTRLLDAGLRVTVTGMDALVETFRRTETSRLFGLVRSRSTNYGAAGAEVADPVVAAVAGIQSGVLDAARALGIGSAAFDGFATRIQVSTQGMTDDQAAQAVTEALAGLGDEFALMTPGLRALIRDGETATGALTRLTTSLAAVNDAADLLGHALLPASLAGGNLASIMADAAGGLDAFGRGVQSYFDGFYSAEERLAAQTRRLSDQMADLGLVMPRSRAEFRRMVDGIDTTTAAGAALYGQVMALAGALDGVLPSIAGLTAELVALQGNVQTGLDAAITAAQAAAQANAAAAADWYRASGSIREYIDRLRGTAGALTSPVQAQAYNQARYQTTLAAAMAGDLQAAQEIGSVAESLRQSSLSTARTRVDAARTEARILSDLGLLQGVGDIEGARHDVIAGLLGQQVTLLQEARAAIASGAALTAAQIATLMASLGGLDDAIAEAQLLNYAYLKERLAVSVEVLADAKVPAYVRTLLRNAATGIEADVDFLVRSDLTPDLKWLALTASSEHIKTVEYLARNDLGSNLTRIALATSSTLKKTVNLVIGSDLGTADKRLALAGSSELLRTVNAVLDADIDPRAMRLALANVGAYDVAVRAALDKTVGTQVRRIVFGETGTYAALVKAALDPNLGPNVRRILLDQQGQYAVNVTGTLGADVPDSMRALILKANTAGARAITIATVFGDTVTAAQRALLVRESSEALRMISAVVNPLQVTPDELIFLRQLAETGSVKRTLDAALQTGDTSRTGLSLLTQLGLGSGVVARALDARVDLADLGVSDARILRQLDAGTGEVYRAIDGRMFGVTGTWTRDAILAQLAAGEGSVARAVDGQVFASTGTWTRNALLAQLAAGEGSVARSIDGQVFATTGTWTRSALLAQLVAGDGSVGRSIDGKMFATTGTWTREQFLAQLAAGEGAITRTINGVVATGTLSAAQLALLGAINGASDGRITLGGTFAFDPTTGFRTWYESSTKAAITTPMDTLRAAMGTLGTSLASLRAALIAEADRQKATTAAAQVAALGRATADMARNNAGQIIATDAQIRALATTAGVGTGGSVYDMVSRLTGLSASDDVTGIARDASGYASRQAYRAKFAALKGQVDIDPLGYLAAYPWVAESALTPAQHFDRVGRARILAGDYTFDPAAFDWGSVGLDIPAFATGGFHGGGFRLVGERGAEIEATGPARYYPAAQTRDLLAGGNPEMIAELRALRAEVAALRDEQRQLGLQTVGNTKRTADVLRKFDIDGLPAERV